jgi:hypothetical protein
VPFEALFSTTATRAPATRPPPSPATAPQHHQNRRSSHPRRARSRALVRQDHLISLALAARQPTSALKHDRLTAKSVDTLLGLCIGVGDAARGQRVAAKTHQAGVAPDVTTQARLRDLAKL